MTLAVSIAQSGANNVTMRNRIINGAMMIDQRNNGASVSISGSSSAFSVDRWAGFQNTDGAFTLQQVSDAPAGYSNSLRFTTTTADSSLGSTQWAAIRQNIEGLNVVDLAFGSASPASITVSFWVKSSLTGTFGGAILNSAENRSYPFTYAINSSNTWEQKTITISGDTSGTWLTTNGVGLRLVFGLGVGSTYSGTAGAWTGSSFIYSTTGATSVIGTLNATWQITGVQLEEGTTATAFEQRLYGQELALCQRYYYRQKATSAADYFGTGPCFSSTGLIIYCPFKVTMRTSVSSLEQSGTASDYRCLSNTATSITCSAVPVHNTGGTDGASVAFTVASGLTLGYASAAYSNSGANAYLAWSAEL